MGFIARLFGEEPSLITQVPHMMQGKGHHGEYLVCEALQRGSLGRIAVFTNLLVPRASGPTSTSEIDVVMLHEKGIFVFESKNYSGWIFGSEDQRNWTVTFNANSKEQFYNPIKQNRAHVKALSDYLGLESRFFRSYIVFSEKCMLKKVPDNTAEYVICRRHHMLNKIRADLKQTVPVFSEGAFSAINARLQTLYNNSTKDARMEHVYEAQQVGLGNVCPWCGSDLVERNGKYGKFMGCSAYPKCRFTRDA